MGIVRRILASLTLGTLLFHLCNVSAATAQDFDLSQSVFFFGGATFDGDMLESANPFDFGGYEDHPVFGVGYQIFPYEFNSLKLGAELGVAGRFGGTASAEFWGGVVGRYDGIEIADTVRISPALSFGISYVTHTLDGREQELEEERNGDASTLFYLGPELNFSLVSRPELEFFWRLHHRSGAWGTLGDMHGGSNANVFGVRYNF
jgi:hypothetical protein